MSRKENAEYATSERVMFACRGCGRDTIVWVGVNAYLTEKRCSRCAGHDRVRSVAVGQSGGSRRTSGTHMGRITDEGLRNRRRAKSLRASRTRMGVPRRMPCANYGCEGHRHRKASSKHVESRLGGRR